MNSFLSAAVAAVAVLSTSSAFAFTSTGTIESVTPSLNEIRIVNGDAYSLPTHLDVSRFTPGQRVEVTWETQHSSTINVGGEHYIQLLDATGIRTVE
ncbi:MAG: hypothetical protein MEQ84_02415 [Mesorhizobium sp.]|nr:hypothetical protein [Mesorhizobium sp.]